MKEKTEKLKKKSSSFLSANEKTPKEKFRENWWKYLLFGVITLYISGLMAQGIKAFLNLPKIIDGTIPKGEIFSLNPFKCFWISISSVTGILCLLFSVALVWFAWFYGIKPRMKEETGYEDDRNFRIAEEGTYGTSALMRKEEITQILDMKDIGEQEGNILGQYEGKVLSMPSDAEFERKAKANNWGIEEIINNKLNNHIAVIGSSGTMKTRAFVRNLIIQASKRGESMIITDPKAELVRDTAIYLKNKGYNVKIFNLVNLLCSDSWDCMATIGNNSIVAKIFADVVAQNAGKGDDAYFVTNAAIILKAVSLFVLESPTETNKTMGRVYDILSSFKAEQIDIMFSTLRENSTARRAYDAFRRCNDNVKGQILNNISAMLSVFQDDAVRDITTNDEIDLENVCYEKSAYFLVMSDQHTSFDFLAVLFYAMSFIKQVEAIDREQGKKEAGLPYRQTIPINYVMDEFSNLGQIPDFVKKISTVRSRKINISVIVQNIPQLMNRYPNNQWQEILGCCDTTIFLGCTDAMTAEYISKKTGIATIEVESTNSVYDRQVMVLNQATGYHEVKSRGQRKVLNDDEVLRLKNTDELIFLRGQKPLICQKFDFTLHPESKKFVKYSATDHKPKWRLEKEAKEKELANWVSEGKENDAANVQTGSSNTGHRTYTQTSGRPDSANSHSASERVKSEEPKPKVRSDEQKKIDADFITKMEELNKSAEADKSSETQNTANKSNAAVPSPPVQESTPYIKRESRPVVPTEQTVTDSAHNESVTPPAQFDTGAQNYNDQISMVMEARDIEDEDMMDD